MSAFRNILVHLDSGAESHPALECGVELARLMGAKLKLVEVVPDLFWPAGLWTAGYERILERLTHDKEHELGQVAERVRADGLEVSTVLLNGKSSVGITREVIRDGHDLVIKLAKGRRSQVASFFGTTAKRLLRKCPCPVLLLRPGIPFSHDRMVAAVDAAVSDDAHDQLNSKLFQVANAVQPDSSAIDIVCAWDLYGESILREHLRPDEFDDLRRRAEVDAEKRLAEILEPLGLNLESPNVHLVHGDAGVEIPKFVEEREADLLVMGTVGRSGVAGLLMGNTAERILDRVQCHVLAVKPTGFRSPITL